jgi:hypothetical protein
MAASTVESQYATEASEYALKVERYLGEGDYAEAEYGLTQTMATSFRSDGVVIAQTSTAGTGGFTNSSWPSASVATMTTTRQDDEGTSESSFTTIITSAAWENLGSFPIGGGFNQTDTESWDGQFTRSNSNGITLPTSTTISASKLTTITETDEGLSTYLTSASTQTVVGTRLGTLVSTTTTQSSAQVAKTTTAQTTQTIVTSTASTIAAYNGQTGTRATATVFLFEKNEAMWVPTTTGMGNNLSDFCLFVTQSPYTLVPAVITRAGVTAPYSASAVYDETTLTQASTVSTVSASTITLTPLNASVIPQTITRPIQTITTTTVTEERFARLSNNDTPTVALPTSTRDTMAARLGGMSWQSTYSKSLSAFTTTSAEGVGISTFSYSDTIAPDFELGPGDNAQNGSTFFNGSTIRALTFPLVIPPKLMRLVANNPCQTASSFYEARAALSKMTSIARDVRAQGITFKPFNESKAAQTAVVQSPLTWTYQTNASSVTASAWAGGLTLSSRSNTTESARTTSGTWVASGEAILTQGSFSKLNAVLSAPTGSPALFVMPGTKFTTVGTSTGSMVIAGTSVRTADSNEQTRTAQSEAPAWIVGDDNGAFFSTTTRNFTNLLASGLF